MRFSMLSRLGAAALFCAFAAFAPAAQAATPHTLTVNGVGEVSATPDQAQLSAGVATVATTADAALADNALKMTAVFAALKKLGVPERAIQTSNFSIQPQYANNTNNDGSPPRITGYQVSNQVDVTLDDSKKLGAVIDALVGAGANQIDSVGFGFKDPAALQTKAREAAIADARARAQTYAKAAGVTLGGVVSIDEAGSAMPVAGVAYGLRSRQVATPVAAGELDVSANVTVVFEIR